MVKSSPSKKTPSEFSPETRRDALQELRSQLFDIVVIGGGITGAGVARDAALRGFKTALIEKTDFAAGTSSKSSKLIHGGFRYLKNLELGMVHESLQERKVLMKLAPHLVRRMKCLLPIYENSPESPFLINMGLWVYDLLAFPKNIGRHRMVEVEEIHRRAPLIRTEGLRKGAEYYDAQADDFRLVMVTVQSAAQSGAVVANYCKAEDIIVENGNITGILARDQLTGEEVAVRARTVVNATGPWSDQVRKALVQRGKKKVRTTKGIHLILRREDLPIPWAFMQFAVQDGRPIFAVPWKRFLLVGTTDTDYEGDMDYIAAERSEVNYLLDSFNYYFPQANLTDDNIISTFAGLRPLTFEEEKTASAVTREHLIFEAPGNFFSIIGGKFTTHRVMAQEITDQVSRRLAETFERVPPNPRCTTNRVPLTGGEIPDYPRFQEEWKEKLERRYHLPEDMADHFMETYGSEIPRFLDVALATADGLDRIHPDLPHVWGELTYAVDYEMSVALDDFLIRRTHVFSLDPEHGLGVYQEAADRLANRLGWSVDEKKTQIDRYLLKRKVVRHYCKGPSRED